MAGKADDAARRIFCALDMTDRDGAAALAARLAGTVGGIKLGLEFFGANGPAGVEAVKAAGLPTFLDLKFHDIPNTVAGAVRAAIHVRPFMLTVHASGGPAMMQAAADAAREAAEDTDVPRPLIIGVTVLTSMDEADLKAVGQQGPVVDQAKRLAALAQASGLDGVVCSPREVAVMRALCGPDFTLVVPGIRPAWSAAGDQKRVMTPAQALAAGADFLVIGRPITGQPDPVAAARRIAAEIGEAAKAAT
jgi:orotidine-5'-phosphate decarboxylase